jgi:hypothetical protein
MKTTLNNDGLTVEVFPVKQGFMVRMIDDDSGGIVGQRIFPREVDAITYARLCLQLQHEADAA